MPQILATIYAKIRHILQSYLLMGGVQFEMGFYYFNIRFLVGFYSYFHGVGL